MNLTVNNPPGKEPDGRLQALYLRDTDKVFPVHNFQTGRINSNIVIGRDIIKIANPVSDIPTNKQIEFKEPENDVPSGKELQNRKKAEEIYKTINDTKTLISISGQLAKIINNDEVSDIFDSSDGALSAYSGIVELKKADSKSEQNDVPSSNTKVIMSSISQVANGVGTVLNVANIPEAEFLMLTGKLAGLGAEQQNLSEQINKKDPRGIIGTTVSLAKGTWGTVVSSVNAAKITANLGAKIDLVSTATVGKISVTATKISKVADKIAIPFAIAGTGLSLWDWHKSSEKINAKKQELLLATIERIENSSQKKILKRSTESKKEIEIEKKIGILKTNSRIMGLSFGVSAISTTALIASVALPSTRYITEPLALGSSIAASVIGTLADDKSRASIKSTYEMVKNKYNTFVNKIDSLLSNRQSI